MLILIFYGNHSDVWSYALVKIESKLNDVLKMSYGVKTIEDLRIGINSNRKFGAETLILPLGVEHAIELHSHNIRALMPNLQSLELFSNKKLFSEYVKEHNLIEYVPRTIDNETEFVLGIAKPNNLSYGRGCEIIRSKEELKKFDEKYVIQEFMRSKFEYVTHIVASNGLIKLALTYCYEMKSDMEIKSGLSYPKKTTKIKIGNEILDILQKFLIPVSYSGICNIDYKIINDQVKVMEINPRLGGSLMEDIHRDDLVKIIKCLLKQF